MNIFFSPYVSTSLAKQSSGALLKVEFPDQKVGYSLLHPWETHGDPNLNFLLKKLELGDTHPLVERAIEIARQDAEARHDRISLCQGRLPPNYKQLNLLSDTLFFELERIFEANLLTYELKFKIGFNAQREIQALGALKERFPAKALQIKLDSNYRFSREELSRFIGTLMPSLVESIQYIEDPFVGTPEEWLQFKIDWDLRLAGDFIGQEWSDVVDVWVLKPTRQDIVSLCDSASQRMKRVVLTTALDHPLGTRIAQAEAMKAFSLHPLLIDSCGLAAETTAPGFEEGEGFGFGYDQALLEQKWIRL